MTNAYIWAVSKNLQNYPSLPERPKFLSLESSLNKFCPLLPAKRQNAHVCLIFFKLSMLKLVTKPFASKFFIAFPEFTLKHCPYLVNCQFKLAVICHHFVCFCLLIDNQLVDAHTKSEITRIHRFYSILLKIIKNKKLPSISIL